MRQQIGLAQLVHVVGKSLFAHAVVRRLAVLQPYASGHIGKREQEMVDAIMMRAVDRIGLAHQVAQGRQHGGTQLRVLRLIGDHIDVVPGRDLRRQRKLVKVLAGDDR